MGASKGLSINSIGSIDVGPYTGKEHVAMTASDEMRRPASAPDRLQLVRDMLARTEGCLPIGGEWRTAGGGVGVSVDPSTGQDLGEFGVADEADVDTAAHAAATAQITWAKLSTSERAMRLISLCEQVNTRAEHLALCDSVDGGLPIGAMREEVQAAIEQLQQWPSLTLTATGEVFERGDGLLHYTASAPYGVVARIIAHNHPTYAAITGLLPVLLAGNTLLLKPADQTPISALALADAIGEALPPGVVNVVTGDKVTGRALVTHPLVRRVAFTGSTATGLIVQQAASSSQVRAVTLELGGKNPMIVFPDADVTAVAAGVIDGMNLRVNQGQSCASTSRIYVHRSIHDDLVNEVAKRLGTLRIGVAYDDATTFGPLISARHAESVRQHIARAVDGGACVVTGGTDQVGLPGRGFFVAPTLLADVRHDMSIAHEEVFGPVIAVVAWEDENEVMEQANDSRYGLSASIWTADLKRALSAVEQVEAGYVWVNCAGEFFPGTPFGGWKDSGIGQQYCLKELASFRRPKTVHLNMPRPES